MSAIQAPFHGIHVNSMQGGTGGNGGPATNGIGGPGGTGEGPRLFDNLFTTQANNYANQRNFNVTSVTIMIFPPILAPGNLVSEHEMRSMIHDRFQNSVNGRGEGWSNNHHWGGNGTAGAYNVRNENKRVRDFIVPRT